MSVYRENARVPQNEAERAKEISDLVVERRKNEALALVDPAVEAILKAVEKHAMNGEYCMYYCLRDYTNYTEESAKLIKTILKRKGFWFSGTDYVSINWGGDRK